MTPFAFRDRFVPRAVTVGLALALWLFGLFTSILLIGLWGRTVAGDDVTLEAGTRAVLESEIVNDRVVAWLGDAIATASQLSSGQSAAVIEAVNESPEMQAVMDDIIDQGVAAALAPPGTTTEIDVTAAADSLVPVVAAELLDQGVVADTEAIRGVVGDVPAIILSAEDHGLVTNTAREVGGALTTVFLVGLIGMVLTGGTAMKLSGDHVRQLRTLAVRIGVSALTFALIFRIGAWAVDPAGGRSPIAAGGAVLLRSNGHVMPLVIGAAMILTAATSLVIVRRRRARFDGGGGDDVVPRERRVLVKAGARST